MTCEFEGNTIYDEAAYGALVHVMVNKVRRTPRILMLSAGILMLFSGCVLLFLKKALTLGSGLMLLGGIAVWMVAIFLEPLATKMLMKEQKLNRPEEYRYQFFAQEFTVEAPNGTKTVPYQSIRNILSAKGYLFFFVEDQVYLLQTVGLIRGSGEDLYRFLEPRIGRPAS
ncbi:MAG TPA: hypothetical protein DD738_06110 [Ruminiclostridium sp.]|nr:hypothetical protein [Ruminiclostridium sp.]